MQRKFIILTSLGGLNTTVFATCYGIASTDNGSSFAGLIPAVICYGSVFASMFLGAFAVYYYIHTARSSALPIPCSTRQGFLAPMGMGITSRRLRAIFLYQP